MPFRDARHTARMSVQEVAEYLNISIATVKRYNKTGQAPKAVIECLRMIGGRFPESSRKDCFYGWSFGQGYLWSPGGERFTSGDVLASRLDQQLVDSLYRSNLKLRNEKKNVANVGSSNVIQFRPRRERSDLVG